MLIGYCLTISLLIGGVQNGNFEPLQNHNGGIGLKLWGSKENCEKTVPITHQDIPFIYNKIATYAKGAVDFEKKISKKSNLLAVLAGVTVGGLSYCFLKRIRNVKQMIKTRVKPMSKTVSRISTFIGPVILGTLTALLSKKFWQYVIGKLNTKERDNLARQKGEVINEGKGEQDGTERLSNPSEIADALQYTFKKEGCSRKVNRVLLGFKRPGHCTQQHVDIMGSILRQI